MRAGGQRPPDGHRGPPSLLGAAERGGGRGRPPFFSFSFFFSPPPSPNDAHSITGVAPSPSPAYPSLSPRAPDPAFSPPPQLRGRGRGQGPAGEGQEKGRREKGAGSPTGTPQHPPPHPPTRRHLFPPGPALPWPTPPGYSPLLHAGVNGLRGSLRPNTQRGRGTTRPPHSPGDIFTCNSQLPGRGWTWSGSPPLAIPSLTPAVVIIQLQWLHPASTQAGRPTSQKKGVGKRINPASKANTQRDEIW